MKREGGEVTIIRNGGYPTDEAWLETVKRAVKAGRSGVAVDADGREHDLKDVAQWTTPSASA